MKTFRLVICSNDFEKVFGVGPRQGRRKLQNIRIKLNKEKQHPVTIHEFCTYYKFTYEEVTELLKY